MAALSPEGLTFTARRGEGQKGKCSLPEVKLVGTAGPTEHTTVLGSESMLFYAGRDFISGYLIEAASWQVADAGSSRGSSQECSRR